MADYTVEELSDVADAAYQEGYMIGYKQALDDVVAEMLHFKRLTHG